MQRAALLTSGHTIQQKDLGIDIQQPSSHIAEFDPHEISADEINQALVQHKRVVARAARELGLSRQAFYRRMEKFGIQND